MKLLVNFHNYWMFLSSILFNTSLALGSFHWALRGSAPVFEIDCMIIKYLSLTGRTRPWTGDSTHKSPAGPKEAVSGLCTGASCSFRSRHPVSAWMARPASSLSRAPSHHSVRCSTAVHDAMFSHWWAGDQMSHLTRACVCVSERIKDSGDKPGMSKLFHTRGHLIICWRQISWFHTVVRTCLA